jgi:hypothetical protein
MVDLLDNFLNILQVFLAVASDFRNRYDIEWEGGKERKMNDGSATANQVRDGGKELKYKFLKIERAMKKY